MSLTVAAAFSDQQSTGSASFHVYIMPLTTKASLLLVRRCENNLPSYLRLSYGDFKKATKTFLFAS